MDPVCWFWEVGERYLRRGFGDAGGRGAARVLLGLVASGWGISGVVSEGRGLRVEAARRFGSFGAGMVLVCDSGRGLWGLCGKQRVELILRE